MSPVSSPGRHVRHSRRRALLPAAFFVSALLVAGCGPNQAASNTRALLERNAQLQNQVSSAQQAHTALGIVLILFSCALAASLYKNLNGKKGGGNGQKRHHPGSRQ